MTVEYAPKGLLGVLTPQANTTVEPELAIMMPPGHAWINGRLISSKPTIESRLLDYFDSFDESLAQFANAPLRAVGFACTGASYLAGTQAEDEALTRMSARRGIDVVTAASAVVDAFRVLGARRIGLVSPYDASLTEKSVAYWTARGLEVGAVVSAYRESDAFHPIYSLGAREALAGLRAIAGADVDAIVMLGTGMPTLMPIAEIPYLEGKPVMSCMLCIGWRMVEACLDGPLSEDRLRAWIEGRHWKQRLAQMSAS